MKCKVRSSTNFQSKITFVNINRLSKHDIAKQKIKILFFQTGSPICPVEIFLFYMRKLNPKWNELWQKARQEIKNPEMEPWYENQVVGRDPLNNAVKLFSQLAKLSEMYTNHCIRASVVTKLDAEGFEARHIMVISSHKSENSIKTYASKCPKNEKKKEV